MSSEDEDYELNVDDSDIDTDSEPSSDSEEFSDESSEIEVDTDMEIFYEFAQNVVNDRNVDSDSTFEVESDDDVQIIEDDNEMDDQVENNEAESVVQIVNTERDVTSNNDPPLETNDMNEGESNLLNVSTQIDHDNCCVICTELWTNSDEHHVVALRCGHLFGKKCIESWLTQFKNHRCPQCNKPAKRRDIVKIYARNLKPLDTSERDQANAKAKMWEDKAKGFEQEYQKCDAKCKMLQKEVDRLKLQLMNSALGQNSCINLNSNISGHKSTTTFPSISHLKSFEVKEGGCRLHSYCRLIEALAVSIPNPSHTNSLFPKFGVKKVPLDSSKTESLFIHSKQIKDMTINQYDGTLLTVSLDKTLKISSLISKSVISTINLDIEPWSIHICPIRSELFYVGLRNGQVLLYDKRMSNQQVTSFSTTSKSPVVSLSTIQYDSLEGGKHTGIMSLQLDSCSIYTFDDGNPANNNRTFKMPIEGKFVSSHFDKTSGLSLISCRPSQKHSKVTHYVSCCCCSIFQL